ncbi:alkylation response protein AidB-like acyl-CoA dehydrogenase [Rhizobium alvei]
MPRVLQLLLDEKVSSANLSFGLFPGLTRGATQAIAHHANDELKQTHLPKMISGEWIGAMALTEASVGTDLGLLNLTVSQKRPVFGVSIRGMDHPQTNNSIVRAPQA